MKIKFIKNHLDFKAGETYKVADGLGKYLVRVKIAKEVTGKGGNAEPAAPEKKIAEPVTPKPVAPEKKIAEPAAKSKAVKEPKNKTEATAKAEVKPVEKSQADLLDDLFED